MRNRRTILLTVIATALLALSLPSLAAAQGTYDPDYGRDRDYRRDRDNRRNDGYNGRYDNRYLRDSVHRLKDLSARFESDIDHALDHSRVDGTRREDQLNNMAQDFHRAARDLKDRFDNGRDLNRSADEAQRVLDLGARLDRVAQRFSDDGRLVSDWSQIRRELNVIANAYGFSNGGYYSDDDYYRRNDPYRRNRNTQTVRDILRRIPF